jgi:hypothetical protein
MSPIDTSQMSPEEASAVTMFERMLDMLPDEGLVMLEKLIHDKIDERRGH